MLRNLRAFSDSNVTLSAALGDPNDFRFFWEIHQVDMLTSQYSIGEVSRHLKTAERRARLWQLIYRSHLVPEGEQIILPADLILPEKDRPILQAAISATADVLITGDQTHFGRYFGQSILGVRIETPRMFKSRYPHLFMARGPHE